MLSALVFSLAMTGCVEDVAKDKVEATVAEAKKEAPAPAVGDTWAVNVEKSAIKALGAKVTATHPVDFKSWKGSMKVADGMLTAVEFTIDMASLESDHPKLTEHLKNEDFFDVPNHPKSTFASTKIEKGVADGAKGTHTVTGNLTIRGATKEVSFPASIKVSEGLVKAQTEFSIDRQDFGISYPGRADDLIQDNVVLTISLVGMPG